MYDTNKPERPSSMLMYKIILSCLMMMVIIIFIIMTIIIEMHATEVHNVFT